MTTRKSLQSYVWDDTYVRLSKFGQPGVYDFKSMNMKQLQARATELEKTRDKKQKKINPKVMNTITT